MTPCQDPANDPDDWFIGRDGKQYSDDPLPGAPTPEDVAAEMRERYDVAGLSDTSALRIAGIVETELEDAALKAQLRKRRHAKDACYACPGRLACLTMSLETRPDYGTFGGYFEEERRVLLKRMDARLGGPRG